MNFHQYFDSHSRYQKKDSNLLQWQNSCLLCPPPNSFPPSIFICFFLYISYDIDGFEKAIPQTIHRSFRIHKTLYMKSIREMICFHNFPITPILQFFILKCEARDFKEFINTLKLIVESNPTLSSHVGYLHVLDATTSY